MFCLQAPEDHRRKWDVNQYANQNAKRPLSDEEEDEESKAKPEMLKARDYKIDLESKLGKTVIISKATPANLAGGYYCNICDCVVKDSMNFLDHINGKKRI